ncbi:hypothetical protein MBLNU230_g2873t1 [Neophaeotheca triangularis]
MTSSTVSTSGDGITPRTRTGCQNCRTRHLKCDEQRPSCTRCERAGIECIRGYNIRFRHGANPSVANTKGSGLAKTEYDFSKTQPWVNTALSLTFLDETPELTSIYQPDADALPIRSSRLTGEDEQLEENRDTVAQEGSVHTDRSVPTTSYGVDYTAFSDDPSGSTSNVAPPSKRRRLTFSSSYQSPPDFSPGTFSQPSRNFTHPSPAHSWHNLLPSGWTPSSFDNGSRNSGTGVEATFAASASTQAHHTQSPAYNASSESLSRIYLDKPVFPLEDKEQAKLLRYFVDVLARNFDMMDPLRHFTTVVPQRAATCPTLLNAIFALSAKHLSRIGQCDSYISDVYHQECLKHLIPMLDDTSAILDDNLLTSTIILRHLEEFEVPLSGQLHPDSSSHLLGAHAFIAAQERATLSGGLRHSAFWVGLRQEIYVAFVNQRSIMPALEHCNIDRSCEPADDYTWACRIVVCCADVIRFCFGDGDRSNATYDHLADSCAQWYACKPASFTPVYWKEANPETIFPESIFIADHLSVGVQHWHIAKILLCAHNPRVPRLGLGRATALKAVDDEIKEHVRVLCGIALSNPKTAPNFVCASMAVTMAGDKFHERHEQEALVDVLLKTEERAWPTKGAIYNLRDAWGWTLSPESPQT